MNMDKILDTVMTFINENTNILIGVCIFLIFVLIGYLIDNSVKSKRVRKDIKNKDQVPENIKKDIIEEAIDNNKVNPIEENVFENSNNNLENVDIDLEQEDKTYDDIKNNIEDNDDQDVSEFESFISDNVNPLDLNAPILDNTMELNNIVSENISNDDQKIEDTNEQPLNNEETTIPIDIINELMDSSKELDLNSITKSSEIKESSVPYKNNKKLSEILYSSDEIKQDNIISDLNIPLNEVPLDETNNTNGEDNSYSNELDNIMKKLNNIDNTDEDNYTNIF